MPHLALHSCSSSVASKEMFEMIFEIHKIVSNVFKTVPIWINIKSLWKVMLAPLGPTLQFAKL